jgi:hypothetical protein
LNKIIQNGVQMEAYIKNLVQIEQTRRLSVKPNPTYDISEDLNEIKGS